MDVNAYMEKSLALQARTVELLEQLVAGQGEVMQIKVPVETVKAVAEQAAATKPDPANGSGKQASNHARDDAQQQEQAAARAEAATGEKPKTAEDVRTALMKLGKAQGNPAAIALLGKYGVKSVSELAVEQYAQIIADAEGDA